jgi:toxin HigB-1
VCANGIAVAGVCWLHVRTVACLWRVATAVVIIVRVIRSFADTATEDLFNGVDSVRARRACPSTLWAVVARKLTQLNRVRELRELAVPPQNRLKALQGDRKGQHSIRINDQYRICFTWEEGYADDVEVTDYH